MARNFEDMIDSGTPTSPAQLDLSKIQPNTERIGDANPFSEFSTHPSRLSQNLIAEALGYHKQGFNVLPCRPRTKTPAISRWKHWQSQKQDQDDVAQLFMKPCALNIAIICGITSHFLYVIDCDDKGLFREYSAEIEKAHGQTWTTSAKKGGHLYCLASRPVLTQKHRGFEIRGHGSYVLAPPSIHPDGINYEFCTKPETILHLDRLPFCALQFRSDVGFGGAPYNASPQVRLEKLAIRYAGRNYNSLSEYDMAIITAGVNIGATLEDIRAVLTNARFDTHYLRLLKDRGKRAAESNLLFSYEKAHKRGDRPNVSDIRKITQYARVWIDKTVWSGRRGLNDKATLLAHVARCEQAANPIYHLSCRDGAELARLSFPTFSTATKRLVTSGFIEYVRAATGNNARCYRLNITALESSGNDRDVSCFNTSSSNKREEVLKQETSARDVMHQVSVQDDTFGVFERRVLGKAAEEVCRVLQDNSLTPAQIARRMGRSPGTVSKVLRRLLENRIILKEPFGCRFLYTAVKNYDFETLGSELDSRRIAIEKRARHLAQRQAYKERYRTY